MAACPDVSAVDSNIAETRARVCSNAVIDAEEREMKTYIPDPRSYFAERGGLHDARICKIVWDARARFIDVEVADLNANALGLPEHKGTEPGSVIFQGAENLAFGCDALASDVQRVYDVEIDERAMGGYRCTLLISPSGRLTFDFTTLDLVTG